MGRCVVMVQLPLTRHMQFWPFPMNSIPQMPQHITVVLLIYCLTRWSILMMNNSLVDEENVFLNSAGCGSPRMFITIDILSVILKMSEPLVHSCAAHTLPSIHFLQLCVGLCAGIAKLLTKFDADSLLNFLHHSQCYGHTLHTFIPRIAVKSGSEQGR